MTLPIEQFEDLLFRRTARTYVTDALIAINLAVFVLSLVLSGHAVSPGGETLTKLGSLSAQRLLDGDWWRLFTAMFLHGNWMHVGLNMLALYQAGHIVERLYGSRGFSLLYLAAGIAGGCASVFWRQDVMSVGASGAVFGVYGALAAFLLSDRGSIPPTVLQQLRSSTLLFTGYSLFAGFVLPNVDNGAHVGGLLAGFVLGWVYARPLDPAHGTGGGRGRRALGTGAVVAVSLALLALTPNPRLDMERAASLGQALQALAREDDALDAGLNNLRLQMRIGLLDGAGAARALERDILPRWNEQIERLSALHLRNAEQKHLRDTLLEYAELRRDAARGAVAAVRDNDPRQALAAQRKYRQAQAIIAELMHKAQQEPVGKH